MKNLNRILREFMLAYHRLIQFVLGLVLQRGTEGLQGRIHPEDEVGQLLVERRGLGGGEDDPDLVQEGRGFLGRGRGVRGGLRPPLPARGQRDRVLEERPRPLDLAHELRPESGGGGGHLSVLIRG